VLGDNGLQDARPHLDRFLHEIVEATLFQRRKAVEKVRQRRLRPHQLHRFEGDLLFRDGGRARQPFAVASVEEQQFRAFRQPQNVQEIVCLGDRGLD
jgi:hypothetical protein